MEPSVYEAEWGYIPAYNDIELGGAKYVKTEGASCGAAVKGLGGTEENCLQWRGIHRAHGGKCTLAINYASDTACELILKVNGTAQSVQLPATEGFAEVTANVVLKRGDNVVELASPDAELPASIDYIAFN